MASLIFIRSSVSVPSASHSCFRCAVPFGGHVTAKRPRRQRYGVKECLIVPALLVALARLHMCVRTMMALFLVSWLRGVYVLEQPASSLMPHHPRFEQLARSYGQMCINTFLGAWKHWTAKLTSFYSNRLPGCSRESACRLCY